MLRCPRIETSQLICTANQLNGFDTRATLALNGLRINSNIKQLGEDVNKVINGNVTRERIVIVNNLKKKVKKENSEYGSDMFTKKFYDRLVKETMLGDHVLFFLCLECLHINLKNVLIL